MNNLIRAEFFKLQRNKTFLVLIGMIAAISVLLHYLVIIDWWQMNNTVFDDAGIGEMDAFATFTNPLFFNLIVSTLAGFFIAVEFSQNGVIKNQMISGNKRSHIFIAKYIIFSLGAIIVTILIPLFTALIEIVILGHGEKFTISNIMYLGRAVGLFTLQFLGYTAMIILLAIVTEDSGKTIIISILFTFVIDIFRIFSGSSPIITMLYENSIFYQFSNVFNYTMTTNEIVKSIVIGGGTLIFIVFCSIVIFNKKEIK